MNNRSRLKIKVFKQEFDRKNKEFFANCEHYDNKLPRKKKKKLKREMDMFSSKYLKPKQYFDTDMFQQKTSEGVKLVRVPYGTGKNITIKRILNGLYGRRNK